MSSKISEILSHEFAKVGSNKKVRVFVIFSRSVFSDEEVLQIQTLIGPQEISSLGSKAFSSATLNLEESLALAEHDYIEALTLDQPVYLIQ